MDYQILFNGAVIVASFFGGWTLNTITRSLERLDNDVRNMPHAYISKDDYRNDIKEVKEMLGKIFDRLETKADK
jgi:hypothetical protein